MIRTNAFLCLCVSAIAVHGAVAGVTLKAPSEGAVVPQLWPEQKEFCETPLGKRISVVRTDNESSGRTTELMVRRCSAMPVRLEWEGDSGRYKSPKPNLPFSGAYGMSLITAAFAATAQSAIVRNIALRSITSPP